MASRVLTELASPEISPIPDRAKLGVVPFTFTATLATSTATTVPAAEERDLLPRPNRTPAGQWTGTPLRASVPLARRAAQHASPRGTAPAACRRTAVRRAESNRMDEGVDWDGAQGAESDSDREEGHVPSRCCAYLSITAVEGLSAWSFEELRVECYAQCLIARGTKPPPAVQPSLAIPPAFVPRIVPRN